MDQERALAFLHAFMVEALNSEFNSKPENQTNRLTNDNFKEFEDFQNHPIYPDLRRSLGKRDSGRVSISKSPIFLNAHEEIWLQTFIPSTDDNDSSKAKVIATAIEDDKLSSITAIQWQNCNVCKVVKYLQIENISQLKSLMEWEEAPRAAISIVMEYTLGKANWVSHRNFIRYVTAIAERDFDLVSSHFLPVISKKSVSLGFYDCIYRIAKSAGKLGHLLNGLADVKPNDFSNDYLKFILRCLRDVKIEELSSSVEKLLSSTLKRIKSCPVKSAFIAIFASQILKLTMGSISKDLENDLKTLTANK